MLDVIRESLGLRAFRGVAAEARAFLSLPHPEPEPWERRARRARAPRGSAEAARRLWRLAQPIPGTLAETYLRARGITDLRGVSALRFHPRCFHRPDDHAEPETWQR